MSLSSEDARIFAQNIVDTVHEALIVLDKDLRVVSASRSFYRKFQVTPEQTEGHQIYELGNHQWNIPELRELLQSIISSRAFIEDFKVRHDFETIGVKVMLLNAHLIRCENGKAGLIFLAIEDITEHSAIQQQLMDSEWKYRKFVEEINSIIIGFNRNGNITFFNHFSEKLFGYSRDEVIGKPFVGTVIPSIDSDGRDNTHNYEEIFTDPAKYYANESEGVRKDGSRLFFTWSAKAVRDSSGDITEILIDGNDITDLKRERKEAEENSAILKALLNFIPEGIMITDADHVVRRVSRCTGELFSIPPEKLLNTDELHHLELMHLYWPNGERIKKPGDLPLYKAAISGKTYTDYEIISRNNGSVKTLSVSAAPVRDSHGSIVGAVGAWRDITESKQMMGAITDLAKFPEEDPFPVLRLTGEGVVLYSNEASKEFLKAWQCHINSKIPSQWVRMVSEAYSSGTRKTLESQCGDRMLWLNIVPIVEQGYINIYAYDITEHRAAEEDLKYERERLKVILDNMNSGVILLDSKGNLIAFNKTVLEWYGYTNESEMMEHSSDYIKDFELRDSKDTLISFEKWPALRAINGEYVTDFEVKLTRKKTGDFRWISITTAPIYGLHKEVAHILMSLKDITERKNAHELLQKALEKAEVGDRLLSAIMDNIPEGISISNTKGKIYIISKHGQDLLGGLQSGMSIEEIVNNWKVFRPDGKVMPTEELPLVRALKGEAVRNIELLQVNSKGQKLPLLCNAAPIRNTDGKVIDGIVVWRDITAIKEAQKAVQESESILSTIIDALPVGIITADSKGQLTRINPAIIELWGIPPKTESWEQYGNWIGWWPQTGERIKAEEWALARALRNGEIIRNELVRNEKFGTHEQRYSLTNAVPLRDVDGRIAGGVVAILDITDFREAEEELQRAKKSLQNTIDSITDGLAVLDKDWHIIEFSNTGAKILGMKREDLLGKNIWDKFPYARDLKFYEVYHRVARKKQAEHFEEFYPEPINKWIDIHCYPREEGLTIYFRDITDRKLAETALRENENSLKRAQAIAHLGSWELDLINNRLTWSDEVYRIFGLRPQEFVATYDKFLEQIHPDDRVAVDTAYTESVRKNRNSYEIEHRVVRKYSGEIRYVHEKCHHSRNTQGHIVRSLGMVHDITDRKRAEEELRESQERFSAAFRTIQDALIISDPETGLIIDVNETWVSHWGYSLEETINRRSTDLGFYTNIADRDRALQIVRKEGRLADFEIVLRTRSGEIRNAVLYIEKLKLPRKPLMLTIIRDITERKHAEEQLHQKTEFLENANRELGRFNRIAVGREMRMIKLKKEINSLCIRLGEQPRYPLEFADEGK